MNTIDLSTWLQLFARLGIGLCAVAGLAFIAHFFCKSNSWRRAIWQIALICSLLIAVVEVTGASKGLGVWLFGKAAPKRVVSVRVFDPAPDFVPIAKETVVVSSVPVSAATFELPKNCWWPAILWLVGGAIVLGRILFAQGVFIVFRSKRKRITETGLLADINLLSEQLRLRRRVRVYEMQRVSGPIAFGIVRPSIGVPKGFDEQFTRAQQQAMLAHELAHLRAHDPLWYLLANSVTAVFWWHPVIWWMRRKLQVASEFAADEAVVMLENGPVTLAECLVTFGRQLTGSRPMNALGVGGFRSNLGKRVEALLNLKKSSFHSKRVWPQAVIKIMAPICLVALLVCTVGWFENRETQRGNDFSSTVQGSWGNSMVVTAFSAAREEREMRRILAEVEFEATPVATGSSGQEVFRKLEEIRFPIFQPRDVSLQEMVKFLTDETIRLDPDKKGIRFATAVTNSVRINLAEPVRNFTLQNVIRAIVVVADKPITFVVDAKGVVTFKENQGKQAAKYSQSFGIDVEKFEGELVAKGFEINKRGYELDRNENPVKVWRTNPALPEYFISQGVKINSGTVIQIFSDASQLIVSGVLEDVMAVENAVQKFRSEGSTALTTDAHQPLVTHLFEVDAKALLERVSAAGILAEPENVPVKLPPSIEDLSHHSARRKEDLLRKFFSKAGIEIEPPKKLFLNDRSGKLIVRASVGEIKQIADVLEVFSSPKPTDPATQDKARLLTEEGESLYEAGKFDLAQLKLIEALRLDPKSKAARYYLQLMEQRNAKPKPNSGLIHPTMPPKKAVPSKQSGESSAAGPTEMPIQSSNTPVPSKADGVNLLTRSYKVEVNVMAASLAKIRSEMQDSTGKMDHEVLREMLKKMGVEMDTPKALFYNDRTGMLIFRATQHDHETIEKCVQYLNTPAPQVTLEVKFAEFDSHYLTNAGGKLILGSTMINSTDSKNTDKTVTATEFVGAGPHSLKVAGIAATNSLQSRFEGIIAPAEFSSLVKYLEGGAARADVLTAPKVTTLSGRQARVSVLDLRTLVTGLETVKGANGRSTNTFKTEQVEFGPVLDVIPTVDLDNTTVKMMVIFTLRDFLGYETPPQSLRKVSEVEGQVPLPRIRVRQITTLIDVPDRHTMVLGGLGPETEVKMKSRVPVLGSVPGLGRLFRSEIVSKEKKYLTVFVTPTITDNSGQPLHANK